MAEEGETTKDEDKKDSCFDFDAYATMLGFIPLAPFALTVGVLLILWGMFTIVGGFRGLYLGVLPVTLAWTAATMIVATGILALIATCTRLAYLMESTVGLFLLVLGFLVVNYIISVAWVLMLIKQQVYAFVHGDPIPHVLAIRSITSDMVANVIFFSLAWSALACFWSLEAVFKEEGNGWECKNYIQIKAEKNVEGIDIKLASMEEGEAYLDIHHKVHGGPQFLRGTNPGAGGMSQDQRETVFKTGCAEFSQGLGQVISNTVCIATCYY